MKILIARMNHETNTFSPIQTPLSAFGNTGPTFGEEAYREQKGMRTAMSAFIDAAEQAGAEIVTPISATANPSGPVAAQAYTVMCDAIVEASHNCDAVLLDLHGAMVSEQTNDGEGDLLARLRAKSPATPIAVALDLHGNVTQHMIDNADVIVSFKTFPHIDMYECGEHAARILFARLGGRAKPVIAWRQPPLLTHTLKSATAHGSMYRAVEAARQAERDGMLAVSILSGFPLADIAAPYLSVVVVGNGDRDAADAVAERIARQVWDEREGFIYQSEPMAQSVSRAFSLAEGATRPVLLVDHGDNCTSGGTCDTMTTLDEALRLGLSGIIAGPLCDPDAVAQLISAGVGAQVNIELGNKCAIPKIGVANRPTRVGGIVRAITDGEYTITGPTYTGQRGYMGRCAVLDMGAATVVISERRHEPWDLGVFESVGVDPRRARFIILKSRMYCRPVFEPISSALVECDSRGVTSSDSSLFSYENLKRPVYPLDAL
ncbi:M81 family metallopeptidase [Bradyrhizobium prioriisuperbiae]|uniref:M81 family metallopeptidase n=1 Tax=Bradyrhizobium prioriisuperbiae TaxID=2854389 RepID=UPI0028EB9E7E|nr:M81 family metallopeptidase [Bradyrhizobium prioritasuperba]